MKKLFALITLASVAGLTAVHAGSTLGNGAGGPATTSPAPAGTSQTPGNIIIIGTPAEKTPARNDRDRDGDREKSHGATTKPTSPFPSNDGNASNANT